MPASRFREDKLSGHDAKKKLTHYQDHGIGLF
jgi:hypothetical protein